MLFTIALLARSLAAPINYLTHTLPDVILRSNCTGLNIIFVFCFDDCRAHNGRDHLLRKLFSFTSRIDLFGKYFFSFCPFQLGSMCSIWIKREHFTLKHFRFCEAEVCHHTLIDCISRPCRSTATKISVCNELDENPRCKLYTNCGQLSFIKHLRTRTHVNWGDAQRWGDASTCYLKNNVALRQTATADWVNEHRFTETKVPNAVNV